MAEIDKHKRVHQMILGPLERPLLWWLAGHMPAWVTSDVLTATGVVGSILIFAGYWLTHSSSAFLWLVNIGFVVNWFGDSLDGTVARYRKAERPKFGFFIDHTVDALSETLVFVGLGLSVYMRLDVACLALVGYLLMATLAYVRTAVDGHFQISYGRVGPTELRILIVVLNIALLVFGNPLLIDIPVVGALTAFDALGLLIAVGLGTTFLGSWMKQIRELKDIDSV